MPFIYVVECRDGTLYTGWTTDLKRRVEDHDVGRASRYTRGRGPVHLVYWEECPTSAEAQRREWAIKRLTRQRKLALIEAWREG